MSIYLYSTEIRKLVGSTRVSLPDEKCNSIVASAQTKNKTYTMSFENYSEENLRNLVSLKKYPNLYIDYRFWNYQYCEISNLKVENLHHLYNFKGDGDILVDLNSFYVGRVVFLIFYYKILYHCVVIENNDLFKTYIGKINIDKGDMAKFMVENKIYIPLTTNFICLLKRIFDSDTIFRYLFCGIPIGLENINTVLLEFHITDISSASTNIFESDLSNMDKLLSIEMVLKMLDGGIDQYENVFVDTEKFYRPLGYYLETIEIDDSLENLLEKVKKLYLDNGGAKNIKILPSI